MNKQTALLLIKHLNRNSDQGTISAELAGTNDETKQVFRVKVTHHRLNRAVVVGRLGDWTEIQQSWKHAEAIFC